MPVQRTPISESQLADLLGVEPGRLLGVERCGDRECRRWVVVTEDEDENMQNSGAFPQLSDATTRRKPKKGKR